ncbi:MAG: T9SS type A sorting domain-containing protein [Bacteroidota bacterium]
MLRLYLISLFWLTSVFSNAQSSDSTLDVACWNIEWFGAPSNGPTNDDLQELNVAKIIKWLDADLYGFVEVVDTMRFRRIVDDLGRDKFDFIISPFCSNATTNTGNAWLSGQKLAFIYRKSVFSNVTSKGLLRNSSTAYTNWASGRFPFMLSAKVTIKGISKDMNFIVIHGKAGDTESDHNRRLGGAKELKDTLDFYYDQVSTFLIGDYNDALNVPIFKGATTSSFQPFVSDSIDGDHYKSITLPLAIAGKSSMINYPNVVDNHIISNEVIPFYIPGSARIVTNVTTIIPDYITADQTSDHYPVISHYDLRRSIITSISSVSAAAAGVRLWPNPAPKQFQLSFTKPEKNIKVDLYTLEGRNVHSLQISNVSSGSTYEIKTPGLPAGIYQMIIHTQKYRLQERIVIN